MESQETKITSESMKKCSGDLMCAALLMNLIGSAMEHGLGVINTSGTQDDFSAQIKKPDSTYRVSVCITNVYFVRVLDCTVETATIKQTTHRGISRGALSNVPSTHGRRAGI